MIIIPLTQEKSAIIDDVDAGKVKKYKWWINNSGNKLYARAFVRGSGNKHRQNIYLHQLIMKCGKGQEIDHINNNGLDCTRANLRKVTRSQNCMNHRIHGDNKSGYRGVCRSEKTCSLPWRATININHKQIFIGYFKTALDAAKAYNKASLKYHGKFGYRNMIP